MATPTTPAEVQSTPTPPTPPTPRTARDVRTIAVLAGLDPRTVVGAYAGLGTEESREKTAVAAESAGFAPPPKRKGT